jgi:hypothetical protein
MDTVTDGKSTIRRHSTTTTTKGAKILVVKRLGHIIIKKPNWW